MKTSNKLISINAVALIGMINEKKKSLLRCAFLIAILAVIIAFSIPRIYKSSVTLAPESSMSNTFSSFASLADMVGINFNMANGSDAIYPEIYPDLISSNDFVVSLFDTKVKSLDGTINTTYYDYIKNCQATPWWAYPLGWIKSMLELLKSDKDKGGKDKAPDPFMLTKEQDDVAKKMLSDIQCSVDKKTNVITIVVTAQDPYIAACMAEVVRKQLQVFITNYRTNKARTDMEYVQKLCDEAFKDYEASRKKYASFSDGYQNITLPSYIIKRDELENEMSLRFSTYKQLSEQLQITKAKVMERTPAFTIVQMASVPLKHSNMSKIMILIMFEMIFVGGYFLYLCYRNRKKLFVFSWQQA